MIGKAYWSLLKFYDRSSHKMSYKKRPILIIGQADSTDFVVLPISSVSDPTKIHSVYDVQLLPSSYPKMNLKKVSYVRTHKQTVVNIAQFDDEILDFKTEYEECFIEIMAKVEDFQKKMIDKAL